MAHVETRSIASKRESRVVTRSGSAVVGTLFNRSEDSGETGEFIRAMRSYETRALEDPFIGVYTAGALGGSFTAVAPDYNPSAIIKLPNESAVLRECIDAKVTNICSFGYRLEYIGDTDQKDSTASQKEKERIENLLEQPNGEYTVTELRSRLRRDMETFGYGFLECGRDPNGQVIFLTHVPAHTMRLTGKVGELVATTSYLKRDGKLLKIVTHRRFRRFIQRVNNRVIYFKEFGDPRIIDPATGQETTELSLDQGATEIYHFTQYSPGSVYGLPCYLANLPSIMGTRESELTNLQFFKDNAIPAMAILVSGGALTDATVANLESHFTQARGRASINRLVVLEASGDEAAATPDGQVPAPRLDLKPLANDRQKDGLFQEYERENEKKIRASFRLPPLFVGRSDDYSHATADASMIMADAQVFGPERNKEDDIWNANFLTIDGLPNEYWRLRTNPPRLVSADAVLKALDVLDDLGAVTPNIAIGIANELFDLALVPVEQEWGNFPFALVKQLALNGTLDGLQEIMIALSDPLHPHNLEKDKVEAAGAAIAAAEDGKDPKEGKEPATGKKPNETKTNPKPKPAEAGPGNAQASKDHAARKKVADRLAYHFRSVAEQGNDISQSFVRKRVRSRPIAGNAP